MNIKIFQKVMTPFGPGRVQGRIVNGDVKILVSHKPKEIKDMPDAMKAVYKGGPFLLWAYPVDQIQEYKP